jgi:lipoate-protein ligase A
LQHWRIVTDHIRNPYENMALDEALLILCDKGLSPSTIRFYTWEPPALSIGYSQYPLNVINVDLCERLNIPVVRRITGGKALIHGQDLSYSVIFRYDTHLQRYSIVESQKKINYCLINALRQFGIGVRLRLTKGTRRDSLSIHSKGKGPFCFLNPASNDIIVSNQKIAGSAQRRMGKAFIQHGSIFINPLEENELKILHSLKREEKTVSNREIKSPSVNAIRTNPLESYTWLNRYLCRQIDIQQLQECIIEAFEETLDTKLQRGRLSQLEKELQEKLKEEKYTKVEWNFFRSKTVLHSAAYVL